MIRRTVCLGLFLLLIPEPVFSNEWHKIDREYAQFEYTPAQPYVRVDPFGTSPLSAVIKFSLPQAAQVSLKIKGVNQTSDISVTFSSIQKEWEIPVYGLYPNMQNKIDIIVTGNNTSKTHRVNIKTQPLPSHAPWIIPIKNKKNENGFYWVSGGKNGGSLFVFDEQGYIRFAFLNPNDTPYQQATLIHDRLVIDKGNGQIAVYSLLGEKINEWKIPNAFTSFQHGIYAGPQNTALIIGSFPNTYATINNQTQKTAYDHIIALDLETGHITKTWNLASILNPDRSLYFKISSKIQPADWIHLNSVQYIPQENSLLISAKHIGLLKIDYQDGHLKWLATPHLLLNKSGIDGKGPPLWNRVLTAIDANGTPYNQNIQQGKLIPDSFHWPMMNHDAKQIMPGLISVFSNNGPLADSSLSFLSNSDVLLFKLDENKKTIQLKKKISLPYYADIASSSTYIPLPKNDLFIFASHLPDKNTNHTFDKIYRYDMDTNKPVFEASIFYNSYFYKAEPTSFYNLKQTHPNTRRTHLIVQ